MQEVGQYDTNDCVTLGLHLSVRPDQSSFASVPPAPVSPVDSIGKFIGERLVTSQCRPGPRLNAWDAVISCEVVSLY